MTVEGLEISYDAVYNTLRVGGVGISVDLLRHLAHEARPDVLYKILERREDGAVIVQTIHDRELSYRFDLLAKAGSIG